MIVTVTQAGTIATTTGLTATNSNAELPTNVGLNGDGFSGRNGYRNRALGTVIFSNAYGWSSAPQTVHAVNSTTAQIQRSRSRRTITPVCRASRQLQR